MLKSELLGRLKCFIAVFYYSKKIIEMKKKCNVDIPNNYI